MRLGLLCSVMFVAMGLLGCSTSTPPQPAAQGQPQTSAPGEATAASEQAPVEVPGVNAVEAAKLPSVPVANTAPPEQVVQTFLDAMKLGDIATKANLLTQKAREETARENFEVNPQGAAGRSSKCVPPSICPNIPTALMSPASGPKPIPTPRSSTTWSGYSAARPKVGGSPAWRSSSFPASRRPS